MNEERFIDNYILLAHSVIHDACKEYKQAYKSNNRSKMQALENWFRGSQFEVFTRGELDPECFIEQLREDVNVRRDRKPAYHKAHNRKGNTNESN